MTHNEAVDQLADAIHTNVVDGLTSLGWLDLAELARARVEATAEMLVAQLADDDERLAAQTVIDLAGIGWDENPEPAWWRTPLGLLAARSAGNDTTESVPHSTAAAMLGVTRGTVAQLASRGTLERHTNGGILKSSVLERLLRLRGRTS